MLIKALWYLWRVSIIILAYLIFVNFWTILEVMGQILLSIGLVVGVAFIITSPISIPCIIWSIEAPYKKLLEVLERYDAIETKTADGKSWSFHIGEIEGAWELIEEKKKYALKHMGQLEHGNESLNEITQIIDNLEQNLFLRLKWEGKI